MIFNKLIPELTVSNLEKSLHFYVKTIGFKIEYQREEENFAFVSLQGSQVMLDERNGNWETGRLERPFGRGINLQIEVDQLNPILKSIEASSYILMKPPWESWYRKDSESVGQREFLIQDPDGYLLRFAEHIGFRSALKDS